MLKHWGKLYNEIANHLTADNSNREARYYVKRSCLKYIYCHNDELYKETARVFRKELPLSKSPF